MFKSLEENIRENLHDLGWVRKRLCKKQNKTKQKATTKLCVSWAAES